MAVKTRKRKSWWELNPKPAGEPPIRGRGGCKVGWEVYATRERAEEMAEYYAREAEHKATLGYDFGYCCPGSIRTVVDGFEVCTP